jgi:hypothetical protein
MREWLPRRKEFLHALLEREAPPPGRPCSTCRSRESSWWCKSCFGTPMFCEECIVTCHLRLPFHQVQEWTGNHFEPSSLGKTGVRIYTGHAGAPCPRTDLSAHTSSDSEMDWQDDDDGNVFTSYTGTEEAKEVVVVDCSGVHRIPIVWCTCSATDTNRRRDLDLLAIGLYPASFHRIQTVFTFDVLDDFLLQNLECKTSALNYYSKLRRITSNTFPSSAPDRYRELLRVSRQWRHLKLRKWHGIGHPLGSDAPGLSSAISTAEVYLRKEPEGSMAIFCPACPQLGINLPDNWKSLPEQYENISS